MSSTSMINRRHAISRLSLLAASVVVASESSATEIYSSEHSAEAKTARKSAIGVVIYDCNLRRRWMRDQDSSFDLFEPMNFLQHCHALGAGGVQMALGILTQRECESLGSFADDKQMFIESIVNPPQDDDDLVRFDAEMKSARDAGALAARTVIIPGRRYEHFKTFADFQVAAKLGHAMVQRAVPVVEKYQVPLAIENHKDERIEQRFPPFRFEPTVGRSSPNGRYEHHRQSRLCRPGTQLMRITRRDWLSSASGSLMALGWRSLASGASPNERVRIGVIGSGVRGKYLIGNLPSEAQVDAICDCATSRMIDTLSPKGEFQEVLATPYRPHHRKLWVKDDFEIDQRLWRGWDLFEDFSGHLMTNWGAHSIDMVQSALGMDHSGPVKIVPTLDATPLALQEDWRGNWSTQTEPAQSWQLASDRDARFLPVTLEYESGTTLELIPGARDAKFYGKLGTMGITRNRYTCAPAELITNAPEATAASLWDGQGNVARPHLENWLDAIRGTAALAAPVEVGHRTVTVCHLVNLARQLRRPLHWNPTLERFVNDPEADRLLSRPRRPGHELPNI